MFCEEEPICGRFNAIPPLCMSSMSISLGILRLSCSVCLSICLCFSGFMFWNCHVVKYGERTCIRFFWSCIYFSTKSMSPVLKSIFMYSDWDCLALFHYSLVLCILLDYMLVTCWFARSTNFWLRFLATGGMLSFLLGGWRNCSHNVQCDCVGKPCTMEGIQVHKEGIWLVALYCNVKVDVRLLNLLCS